MTSFDAEKNIEYLDGTPYKHIKNMTYMFNDANNNECFNFQDIYKFGDVECTAERNMLCELKYDCPGM